ncbi:MAG: glutamine synthetase, partial [Pseudomonadota bacterium]
SYAPTRANWGDNNRSVALRLPAAPEQARRIEHRVAGADANPYLVLACILQGMMDGLAAGTEPPPALTGNAYDSATANRGEPLPADMHDALSRFENSNFIERALGVEMRSILTAIKRAEIAGFANDISPLERRTYL